MLVSSGDVILCALSLKSYILKRIYIVFYLIIDHHGIYILVWSYILYLIMQRNSIEYFQ